MVNIGRVTDSTADFAGGLMPPDVGVVPLSINWDGQSYRDKVDLTTGQFYERLRGSKSIPKSGAPSLTAFEDAYRSALEQNDSVVAIFLSGKLSGTLDVARKAAERVDPSRIVVVDSGSISLGLGFLVEQARALAQAGSAAPEIAAELQEIASRIRIYFVLETLAYLQRGGRIGRAQALAGTLLNVKPILELKDGEVHPFERVRTYNAACRRLVEIVSRFGQVERIGIAHGAAPEAAAEVHRQLQPHFPDMQIGVTDLSAVLGVHGGPGTIGIAAVRAR